MRLTPKSELYNMANTFKTLLFSLLLTGLTIAAKAQSTLPDTVRIGIGVEAGLTNGDLGKTYKSFIGASFRVDYPITKKLYVTASAGYNIFGASTTSGYTNPQAVLNVPTADLKTIPLKLGIKYFLAGTFYVQGEAGQTLLTNKKDVYAVYGNAFTFAPQIGALFPLKNKMYIDAGIRYEGVSSFYNNSSSGLNFWAAHITWAIRL